ncbi:MAG: multidrug efflux SMR transporter [Solirubrobacteraceae bacterium]|nr:multidrug efflux SMR transporter [Solirubrobacteraceae bacterium]
MPWLFLILAGLLEVGWAVGLSYTEGFTKPAPTALTVVAIVASMAMLGLAVRDLPVSSAYAIWVGIGATGTALAGWLLLGEGMDPVKALFLLGIVVCVAGLKFA